MNNYSEYFHTRKPANFAIKSVVWWHKRMLRIAHKFIPDLAKKTILEIGVGHGFFAQICKKQSINYLGHDMNEQQSLIMQQQGYNITQAKIPPIPSGEPVQVIWLSHVLEHATTYLEAREMLKSCYSRLDHDGFVVIIAPDIHHWRFNFWSIDWSHGFPTSLINVKQLLLDTGFGVEASLHHTCTITNSVFASIASCFFRLIPFNVVDSIFNFFFKKSFARSFMVVFGWRQIYLIGRKR